MKLNAYKITNGSEYSFRDIYIMLEQKCSELKLVSAGKNKYYSQSLFKTETVEGLVVNYGFSFQLSVLKDILYLAIKPKRFLTKKDGEFDFIFHKENSHFLSSFPIGYETYVDTIAKVVEVFGESFNIENIVFTKIKEIPEAELLVTGSEPKVMFGPSQHNTFPAAGLKFYGPWDVNMSCSKVPQEIFVGILGVDIGNNVLKKVRMGDNSRNGFPGFENVYRKTLTGSKSMGEVIISEDKFLACNTAKEIKDLVLEGYSKFGNTPDVLIIRLPNSIVQKIYNINLHDWLKVVFWEQLQPTQIILEETMKSGEGMVVDNIALGIYVSAGGKPWILEEPFENQTFMGVGFGRTADNAKVVGIMELVDNYGLTLDMQLSQLKIDPATSDRDLHLDIDALKKFVDKAFERNEKNNIKTDRLVIHKTTSFNDDEKKIIEYGKQKGIVINLVHVDFIGNGLILMDENKYKLPSRLLYWAVEENKAILYTTGGTNYSSRSPFVPKPIVVNLVNNDGDYDLKQACIDMVKLTKLNWNSAVSFEKSPATLSYASNLAKLLKLGLKINDINCEIKYIF